MNKVPTIHGSAQARLLLFRLLSSKLVETEQRILSADISLWEQIIATLESLIEADGQLKSDQPVLTQVFAHIERSTREGLQRQIKRLTGQSLWLGVFPQALLDSFIEEHQKLIKSVQRECLDKISLAVKRGIRDGRLQKDIIKDLTQTTDISKRRARLIARNAPLQYSGTLTKHHQICAGIKQYRWQTSQDERVRESHRKLDNKVFNWKSAGPYPRSEINCRCDSIPILTPLLDLANESVVKI